MSTPHEELVLLDQEPSSESFFDEVLLGLESTPKSLPSKYFYDKRGSQLFDRICELDEYYLSRTEMRIMQDCAPHMAAQIGADAMLVEYGSGSSVKTRILLDHLDALAAYVPVDISRKHLEQTCLELAKSYPELEVLPVCADFTTDFELPVPQCEATHAAVYLPGSTIGNFAPDDAEELLVQIANLCGSGGGLLIGIDLQKDIETLESAYDDAVGVTAEFNLNLLHRINRELDGNFCVEQFRHAVNYSTRHHRMEIYLQSLRRQSVTIGESEFNFAEGELICTEYSHKYTVDGFARLAGKAGFTLRKYWTDAGNRFAVLHLVVLN